MSEPRLSLPTEETPVLWRRYDAWRARRHHDFVAKHAGRFPGWRNRRGYRRLVLAEIPFILLALTAGVMAFFTGWFAVPLAIAVVGIITLQWLLRVVTGSIGDAPVTALDEFQLVKRNAARSFAYIAIFTLMFIPYFILVALSTQDQVSGDAVYGTAIVLITLLLCVACLPAMLTAWWLPEPDPEDLEY